MNHYSQPPTCAASNFDRPKLDDRRQERSQGTEQTLAAQLAATEAPWGDEFRLDF